MTSLLGDPASPLPGGTRSGDWYTGPVPKRQVAGSLLFVRLTTTHPVLDHAALMASAAYLRAWSDSEWPVADFTVAENEKDLAWHDAEHEARIAFTYSVQDAEGSWVLGCLYVRPLRDMLLTRGVAAPAGPSWPGGDTPCASGWLRRDEPGTVERRFLDETLRWLSGPAWAFSTVWWVAASNDGRQLRLLDELG